MYAVRVRQATAGITVDEELSEEAARLARELMAQSAAERASGEEDDAADSFAFSAGNPRVEHITGVVHLFRRVPSRDQAEQQAVQLLPEDRGDRLCVLAIPGDMGVSDFCQFVGAYLSKVREMRLVRREGTRTVCLVLLRFADRATADEFYHDYNNRPFSSLEPDVLCRLVYVRDVEVTSGAVPDSPPPAGTTELPTCPVCLERLDHHISGVVTTVCNHKFHNECLQRWGDTSCPVCRYCAGAADGTTTTSHCSNCGTTQDLWICLICGHIGCGRYKEGHGMEHWKESGHCYALELETQRVWDYVSDGYVHRLIQSKTDGKLVEVPSPAHATSSAATQAGPARCTPRASSCGEGEGEGGYDEEYMAAVLASKKEAVYAEYNHLLVSELHRQREYWEGRLAKAVSEADARCAAAAASAKQSDAAAKEAIAAVRDADQRRRAADKKLAEARAALTAAQEERSFLAQLNQGLEANQADWRRQLADCQAAAAQAAQHSAARIADLEEQVHDLMMFIEAGRTIKENGGELKDATVLPLPAAEAATPGKPAGKRRAGAGRKGR